MKNILELRLTNVNDGELFKLIKNRCRKNDPRFDYYFEDWGMSILSTVIEGDMPQEVIRWKIIDKKDNKAIGDFNRIYIGGNIILRFNESSTEASERLFYIVDNLKRELSFLGIDFESSPEYIDHSVSDAKGRRVYVPTRCQEFNQWKEAYKIILKMQKESRSKENRLDEVVEHPTCSDYRDRIKDVTKDRMNPSDRTIYRIIRAGKAGLLD